MQFTLGADPEFFLSREGKYVSAHDLVPGTKDNPHPLKDGALQADGTAVEFNVNPASTPEEFAGNVESVLKQIREMIDPVFKFEFKPAIHYDPVYFKRLPIYAKRLGCDPDFSSITGQQNKPPRAVGSMRTGAGHIHVGWGKDLDIGNPDHLWDCRQVITALDGSLGFFSHVWDNDQERRKMYGQTGCFRPKPYGVEYRVPSNAWLNNPELWPFIFKVVQRVMTSLERGLFPTLLSPRYHIGHAAEYAKQYYLPLPQSVTPNYNKMAA